MSHEDYIRQTFELANKALGQTWPNPLVGCVIVKDGKKLSEGFHHRSGHPHAEIEAINNASESIEGSVVYVNLEPCCHLNKKTPPCAQRLIKEKVKKVIVSNLDPNPLVSGQGIELLKNNGIEVEVGILSDEGEKLNEVFFTSQRLQRPFVHLKMASSLDGKVALPDGQSKWITGTDARAHVHLLRSQHQAIIIGAGTFRADSPELTVRLEGHQGPQPLRVIIGRVEAPPGWSVFSSIEEALKCLWDQKIINVFVEGGPTLAGSFLEKKLVDRMTLYLNPSFIGQGMDVVSGLRISNLNERIRLKSMALSTVGEDILITGRP